MAKKKLVLLSHPNFSNSIYNKYFWNALEAQPDFCLHHLDEAFENGALNFEREFALVENAKAIVWQFPLYWYSSPASLRIWQDTVLSRIVYSENNILKGLPLKVIFTAGADEAHYNAKGLNRYTVDEMLRPLEMVAHASGMIWQKPLGLFGCEEEGNEAKIDSMKEVFLKEIL